MRATWETWSSAASSAGEGNDASLLECFETTEDAEGTDRVRAGLAALENGGQEENHGINGSNGSMLTDAAVILLGPRCASFIRVDPFDPWFLFLAAGLVVCCR